MTGDTLYIIGNGFDLHHRLKTSYSDFRDDYAKKSTIWKPLHEIYGDQINEDMWWSRFEEMLGVIDYSHLMNSYNGMALGSNKTRNFLCNKLPLVFGRWIKHLNDTAEKDEDIQIDKDAQFFSFNYTLLLEKAYDVAPKNIWHIHHSLTDIKRGDFPIVGHDSDDRQLTLRLLSYQRSHPSIRWDIAELINQEAIFGAKKVKQRISRQEEDFSARYSSILHYISMGFSFNALDLPYIEKIIQVNNNPGEADWTLYCHSEGEDECFMNRLQDLGVDKDKISLKKW